MVGLWVAFTVMKTVFESMSRSLLLGCLISYFGWITVLVPAKRNRLASIYSCFLHLLDGFLTILLTGLSGFLVIWRTMHYEPYSFGNGLSYMFIPICFEHLFYLFTFYICYFN